MSLITTAAAFIGSSALKGILPGVGFFAYTVIANHISSRLGITFQNTFQESLGITGPSPKKLLHNNVQQIALKGAIGEEVFFRGILQPFLSQRLETMMPDLAHHVALGIPLSHLTAATLTGIAFGAIHYPNFKKGGAAWVASQGAPVGIGLGLIREAYGLPAAMTAHMTTNFMIVLSNRYHIERAKLFS